MQPWQVSLGITALVFIPGAAMVYWELQYLDGFWNIVWELYGFHIVSSVSMIYLVVGAGVYQIVRSLSLGDVGSRIQVLDKTIREGRAGDAELSEALQREDTGEYSS